MLIAIFRKCAWFQWNKFYWAIFVNVNDTISVLWVISWTSLTAVATNNVIELKQTIGCILHNLIKMMSEHCFLVSLCLTSMKPVGRQEQPRKACLKMCYNTELQWATVGQTVKCKLLHFHLTICECYSLRKLVFT